MSTVVIVRKDSRVCIAADSLATSGSTKINAKYARGSDKIMRHGDSYLGLVGDVAHAALRLAGVDWGEDEEHWTTVLAHRLPDLRSVSIKNDGYSLLRCGHPDGVAVNDV